MPLENILTSKDVLEHIDHLDEKIYCFETERDCLVDERDSYVALLKAIQNPRWFSPIFRNGG